jgi:hypothetical protein
MSGALAVLSGLAAVAGTWIWLARVADRDRQQLAQALGLTLDGAAADRRERGRGDWLERCVMRGALDGLAVEIWLSTVRVRRRGRAGSRHQTVVRAPLAAPSPQRLWLEPRVTARLADLWFGEPELPEVVLDDAELDTYFLARCADRAWARRVFDEGTRARLLAWRQSVVPARGGVADYLTDMAALGPLRIEADFVEVALRGTPQRGLEPAIRAAVALLRRLAERVNAAG